VEKFDLILAGVGGQGVVLAGDIAAEAALASGYDVKKTDTLGMAQRGGSVISHLRIARKVWSPLVKEGGADILLAFEKLEAARWAFYLRPGGITIVNDLALPPLSVSLGSEEYPEDDEIKSILSKRTGRLYLVSGTRQARELGNLKTLNTFMLGCLSFFMPLADSIWQECISRHLPARVVNLNITAFEQGKKGIREMSRSETELEDVKQRERTSG
jgi:indolepyruvate ferredoxin oxidoreductase beta subunit